MPASRASSRASSVSSAGPRTVEAQATALVGAIQAFGRPPPPKPLPNHAGAGVNGALAAAAWAGSRPSNGKYGPNRSPGAVASPKVPASTPQPLRNSASKVSLGPRRQSLPRLSPPKDSYDTRSQSPSNYAAKVAAARSPNPGANEFQSVRQPRKDSRQHAVTPPPQQEEENREVSRGRKDERPDDTPIPPTTSLVDLFERKTSYEKKTNKTPEPVVIKPLADLSIQSPKPVRKTEGGVESVFKMDLEEDNDVPKASEDISVKDYAKPGQVDGSPSPPSKISPKISPSGKKVPRSSPIAIQNKPSQLMAAPANLSVRSPSSFEDRLHPSPSPNPRRPSTRSGSRSPTRSVTSPPHLSSSHLSNHSLASQYHQLYPRRKAPLHDESSLANAIVASSLASSRAPSPRVHEPPPVPTRRRHHTFSFSRTPSPSKHMMKHTLRKADESETSSSEDELHPYGKHKKKRHLRKHPNKHHEGDRKRWRDAVTERERRRYEGVWAANRGLYCSDELTPSRSKPPAPATSVEAVSDSVSNIVVRDIWNRSRLPETVLEAVWDLVDTHQVGRLTKDEFVVGLWLIDQRLKGRKLPVKVTDSVWASARNLQGIKIRKK